MIALIDYGAGNLTSVKKALAAIGADVFVPVRPEELAAARGIIVPGVGHFGATRALDDAWVDAIRTRVDEGRPLLGICLGMQWLFEASDEAPELPGLGVLPGVWSASRRTPRRPKPSRVRTRDVGVRLQPDLPLKIPHVGWNSLAIVRDDVDRRRRRAAARRSTSRTATSRRSRATRWPSPSTASRSPPIVQRGHVAGVQFHPEKSGDVGLQVSCEICLRLTSARTV